MSPMVLNDVTSAEEFPEGFVPLSVFFEQPANTARTSASARIKEIVFFIT